MEQIGTESDWISGAQQNHAWFQLFPNPPFVINDFPLNVGDQITGAVTYIGAGGWNLVLINDTQNAVFFIGFRHCKLSISFEKLCRMDCGSPFSFSDWSYLPLADFGQINFSDCQAVIDGIEGPINSFFWVNAPITMAQGPVSKATPSDLSPDGESFTVTWQHN